MGDDILGHDHLDHGNHLHHGDHGKGKKKHSKAHGHESQDHGHHAHDDHEKKGHAGKSGGASRYDMFGERPTHVGVWGRHKQPRTHAPRTAAHASHLHQGHSHAQDWKKWVIGICIALPLAFVLWKIIPAITILILALVINTIVAYIRHMMGEPPIDIEFLSVTAAVLASYYGIFYAIILAIAGPILSELSHGHIGDFMWVKMMCLLLTSAVAFVIGPTIVGIWFAVLFGIITQFFTMLAVGTSSVVGNVIRRTTNLIFSTYIIFIIMPMLK